MEIQGKSLERTLVAYRYIHEKLEQERDAMMNTNYKNIDLAFANAEIREYEILIDACNQQLTNESRTGTKKVFRPITN